jgi:hypothetical protein
MLKKTVTYVAKAHKYFGFVLLITAFVHGYMVLGTIRLHTGVILWVWVLIQVIVGNLVKKIKKSYLYNIHRIIGVTSLIFLVFHIIQVN